jgi:hypothetical protein
LFRLVSLSLASLEFFFASFSHHFASFRIFFFEAKKGHPTFLEFEKRIGIKQLQR